MTTPDADDEFTELYDARMPRVDIVGKGASGVPRWLIAKGADDVPAGLLDPDYVRSLIAKSPEPSREVTMPTLPNGITVTGSPADVAAFIHDATARQIAKEADEDVAKAPQSTKSQNDLPDSDFAYIEPGGKKDAEGKTTPRSLRHFPVNDAAHVRNALARASSSPFGDKAMPKIKARAKELGIEVSKADAGDALDDMLDDGQDGLDPTVPAAAPDGLDDLPGDPTDPGSSAWEAIDAATANKWSTIIAGAKRAVEWLIDREELEAVTVDPDDAENACDLSSACDALDYAIGQLAPYAVSEQSESDRKAFEADVAKGAAEPGSVMAAVVAIAKAGRVLSSANESRIRQASQHLNDVLASLPQAPDAGGPAAVTKEEGAMPETETADDVAKTTAPEAAETPEAAEDVAKAGTPEPAETAPETPVAKSSPVTVLFDHAGALLGVARAEAVTLPGTRVAKADGDADGTGKQMQAVFDQNGCLIGVCDPADITPVAGAGSKKDDAPEPEAKPEGDGEGKGEPQAGPAAAAAEDLTPQPSADAGTPADGQDDDEDVTKAAGAAEEDATTNPADTVLKSIETAVRKALEDSEAAHQEAITKMAGEQAQEIEALKARLATVEEQPAMPKVFTNGQVPPAHQLRGQDQGAESAPVDVAKARDLKQTLYRGTPAEQNEAFGTLQQMAVDKLAAVQAGPRGIR